MNPVDSWGVGFAFDNPYDRLGVPQDASPEELESIVRETFYDLNEACQDRAAREQLEISLELLRNPRERDYIDGRLETRFLGVQDIVVRLPSSAEDLRRFPDELFGDRDRDLREFSRLPRRQQ